jgi:hypothetical protein
MTLVTEPAVKLSVSAHPFENWSSTSDASRRGNLAAVYSPGSEVEPATVENDEFTEFAVEAIVVVQNPNVK